MMHRGIDLGAEFRYLEPTFSGMARGNYTPGDRLTDTDRWGFSLAHQEIEATSIGMLRLGFNVNRVSDDNYWRDYTFNGTSTNATTFAGAAITSVCCPTMPLPSGTWDRSPAPCACCTGRPCGTLRHLSSRPTTVIPSGAGVLR